MEKNITKFKKDNICILTNDSSNLKYDYNNIIITKNLETAYSLLLNNLFFTKIITITQMNLIMLMVLTFQSLVIFIIQQKLKKLRNWKRC